jgi:hypothetical protein
VFRPKLPDPQTLPAQYGHVPACTCHHQSAPVPTSAPGQQIAPYVRLGVGVAGAMLVMGVVLTALLVAVAVAAVSVAVAVVVLRSLLTKADKR